MVELERVERSVGGRLCRFDTAADDAITGGHANPHIGGEGIGRVACHREPAGGVQQEGVVTLDRGELDAEYR